MPPTFIIAAGKAAASMAAAALQVWPDAPHLLAVGTHGSHHLPPRCQWFDGSHPLPNDQSVAAGERALQIASAARPTDRLLLLLSGGASSLLSAPAAGITLADKRDTIRRMMLAGADIHALNTVRKHLSAIKGGHLAARCAGTTSTWAVSDVVDDDLSVIGSGPGVPDVSRWRDAHLALARWGGDGHAAAVRRRLDAGQRGDLPDTPKPGSPEMARATAQVIASRHDAADGARRTAEAAGYQTILCVEPTLGVARDAGPAWWRTVDQRLGSMRGPICVIATGETTVRVLGSGRGGRNQEFVLSLASILAAAAPTVVASVGTDGIDGPTDAAGAIADEQTLARAGGRGLAAPEQYLDRNDAYAFFDALGDLVRIGPTDTNVGDLQVLLTNRV